MPSQLARDRRRAETSAVRQYRSRAGLSFNLEQQMTPEPRHVRPRRLHQRQYRTVRIQRYRSHRGGGPRFAGKSWGRPDDTVGLAGVVNGISGVHQAYLNAGGLGILVGDGMLPHPAPEQIVEAYYQLPCFVLQ